LQHASPQKFGPCFAPKGPGAARKVIGVKQIFALRAKNACLFAHEELFKNAKRKGIW